MQLVIAMGLGIMALALAVSLTLVAVDAGVTSLDDLPMFSSLMMIGIGMVVGESSCTSFALWLRRHFMW